MQWGCATSSANTSYCSSPLQGYETVITYNIKLHVRARPICTAQLIGAAATFMFKIPLYSRVCQEYTDHYTNSETWRKEHYILMP